MQAAKCLFCGGAAFGTGGLKGITPPRFVGRPASRKPRHGADPWRIPGSWVLRHLVQAGVAVADVQGAGAIRAGRNLV